MLELKSLLKTFPLKKNFFGKILREVHAVNSINVKFKAHHITGVVGESGSGKSTLARILCGIYKPQDGFFTWNDFQSNIMKKADWKNFRRNVQMVFQDPYSSLNPRMRIQKILEEPFIIHDIFKKQPEMRTSKIREVMEQVGLSPESLDKYPHEFSGGQRQRIAIARALVLDPELIIFDEPVSALDVSIQAQILNLILDIQKERKMTGVFIAHDLSVISYISDYIAVMYGGKIVEYNSKDEIFNNPRHPYTRLLLKSIPRIGEKLPKDEDFSDATENVINAEGCPFFFRCERQIPECRKNYPERTTLEGDFYYECFNPEILTGSAGPGATS